MSVSDVDAITRLRIVGRGRRFIRVRRYVDQDAEENARGPG
jgi:hypothetical protein